MNQYQAGAGVANKNTKRARADNRGGVPKYLTIPIRRMQTGHIRNIKSQRGLPRVTVKTIGATIAAIREPVDMPSG